MNNVIWAKSIIEKIVDKYDRVLEEIDDDFFPYSAVKGKLIPNRYDENGKNSWWTDGFFPGILWLLYEQSSKEKFMNKAKHYENMLDVALENFVLLHHDVGFMWIPSSVTSFRLTNDEKSYARGLHAASILASRFNIEGGYLRAWNSGKGWNGKDNEGWVIIDSMMNIPILYWASDVTKDDRFKAIAIKHADKVMNNFLREDNSVCHIVRFDAKTGERIEDFAGQGYSKWSSWTRGQGWAIYGFALSYLHTGKKEYLDTAMRIADYFMNEMEKEIDFVPPCDFKSPKEPVYKDSTAAAIVACGLLEIANSLGNEGNRYYESAMKILKALEKNCLDLSDRTQYVLDMGTERYGEGVNIPIIYGDFFFIEALSKIIGNGHLFW